MPSNIGKQKRKKEELLNREFYSLRSILGYSWAIFYVLLGGREAGKSYAVTKFYTEQWVKYRRPFYWFRLTEASKRKLLTNNAEKLIDPDLRRKFKLDIVTNGDNVYEVTKRDSKGKIVEKELMARVMDLSTFYNDKGSGLYDADFLNDPNMYYNICLDEMNKELGEKRQGDIVYQFANQLENVIRSTKTRTRVIMIGNTLEEASDLMLGLGFIPEKYGRYKLVKNKRLLQQFIKERDAAKNYKERQAVDDKYKDVKFGKRAIVEYIEPSEKYRNRRSNTVGEIWAPDASTFTNEIKVDTTLIYKSRLVKPQYIIKFSNRESEWFTVWDNSVIVKYHGEKCKAIAMRPTLNFEIYSPENQKQIITLFDMRGYLYRDLMTFKDFKKQITLLKPRKNG